MEKLKRKKIIIISVYLALFILLIFGIYSIFRSDETCFDGIKNQNEQDVDCGGICQKECDLVEAQDLIIGEKGAVSSGTNGKYDFYVQIINPNAVFGSDKFDYLINFKNSSGDIVAFRSGSGFILPGERKYIIENNIESSEIPSSFDFNISNLNWDQFNEYEKPNIQIVNKNYSENSSETEFSEASGLLKNESPFDFDLIKIQIILKNAQGEIVALNSTQMKTVKSGEERDFKAVWTNGFSGSVANMEVQADVNIFDSETFLKRFYQVERFQQ